MNPTEKKDKPKLGVVRGYKKKESPHQGAEETLKRAAEEEAERQRQAAAAAEEARLAAQREEELRLKKRTSIELLNEKDRQKDLTDWVRSIQFSQNCTDRIDRDFSDGCLLAEVIHHFCPNLCDKRQYFRWNSKINKISNWDALNNKVFPKLGFRLNQKQINNLINPYKCGKFEKNCEPGLFIYKLLYRIRKELAERNSSVLAYRKPNFVPPSCEKQPPPRKFVNFLEHPPYSKVEMLIEQGFYDKKDGDGPSYESQKGVCQCKSYDCFRTSPTYDLTLDEDNDDDYNDVCLQPSLSFEWAHPALSCFLC